MSDEELDEYEDSSDSKQIQNNNSEPTVEEKLGKYVNKILATSPIDELYMLQEQVSEYLGVKSFKRKYPEIFRRLTEVKEREFLLRKMQVVTESQCDLGLTALKLNECLDLMAYDYPDKFKEFDQYFNEKRRRAIATAAFQAASLSLNRNKSEIFDAPRSSSSRTNLSEKDKMKEMVRKAMESVATYNSQIQREKLEERKSFYDLQTMRIQSPQSVVNKKDDHLFSNDKKGHYPVSLLPGQFQYYYKNYTSHELKYLPLDTVIYAPPIPDRLKYIEWKKSLNKPKQNDSIRKVNELRPAKTEVDSDKKISPVKNSDAGRQSIRITASAAPTIAKLISCTNQICHICQKSSQINQNSSFIDNNQLMVSCSSCTKHIHPVCLELNPTLVDWTCIRNYNWQCIECKVCSKCNKSNDEDKMMFCDRCDRGFHTYCANVENVPNGSWLCKSCTDFTDKLNAIQEKINNSKTQIKPEVNTPNKIKQNLKQKLSAALTPTATPSNGEKRGRGRPPGSANKPKDPNLQKKIKAVRGQKIKDSVNGFYSNSNSQMYSLQSPMTNSNLQFDDELNDSLMNYEANNYETQFGSVNSTPYFQMDEASNSQFQF
ncbi:PHD finger 10 [Brachionus plicatilis]|uniref:PHD finger 10 n=1 Tax=Brachionus plicatilis TaxID=10195 RepID=A0A3M7SGU7_BRAPC|nr:PHD finger 10 [Brachionus plicatilis]